MPQFSHLAISLISEFLLALWMKLITSLFIRKRKKKYAIGAITPKTIKFILV
jgi:hypothetical protein